MDQELSDEDYAILAEIRYELRRFLNFSEQAASASSVTPQQHQILLAVRAAGGRMLIGALAEQLLLRPHSASEHVDRLARSGLVRRTVGTDDRRHVPIELTAEGRRLLASLSRTHRDELRRIRPLLMRLIAKL